MSNLKTKFQVNVHVRISKITGVFAKKYLPDWSTEICTIRKIQYTQPTTYLLKDSKNQNIEGGFYQEQLQKVRYPDAYLVEKVLKRKKNKVYVRWLGFDKTHDSWIDKDDVL